MTNAIPAAIEAKPAKPAKPTKLSIAAGKLRNTSRSLGSSIRRRVDRLISSAKNKKQPTLDPARLPIELVDALLLRLDLTLPQRAALEASVEARSKKFDGNWWDQPVKNAGELSKLIQQAMRQHRREPVLEFKFCGRWYPIQSTIMVRERYDVGKYALLESQIRLVDAVDQFYWFFTNSDFFDAKGDPTTYTVTELLAKRDLRPFNRADIEAHRNKMQRAIGLRNVPPGALRLVTGSAVVYRGWLGFAEIPFGTKEQPLRTVLEADLEVNDTNRDRWDLEEEDGRASTLPFVRVFSFKHKKYVYVDVDDLAEYKFDDTALERLVIPPTERETLSQIFNQGNAQLFGDVLDNKHGGMIILANGPSGVGKTLTAEVFAETTHRPLYVMEVGELGTDLGNLEKSLSLIFDRATRWNAVLLFDEADIFMQKRGDDLERSAIVGVFLRLLDYFPGLLFLTTNRRHEIDEAFNTRITLKIDYSPLDHAAQVTIWEKMFQRAGLTYTGEGGFAKLASANPLNGRVIRNTVRLLKVMNPEGSVSETLAQKAIGYSK